MQPRIVEGAPEEVKRLHGPKRGPQERATDLVRGGRSTPGLPECWTHLRPFNANTPGAPKNDKCRSGRSPGGD